MNIQVTKPEVEALLNERLKTGAFKDAEEVVFQALQSFSVNVANTHPSPDTPEAKNMFELFAPLRGLNIDFEADRKNDTGQDMKL